MGTNDYNGAVKPMDWMNCSVSYEGVRLLMEGGQWRWETRQDGPGQMRDAVFLYDPDSDVFRVYRRDARGPTGRPRMNGRLRVRRTTRRANG